MKRLAMVLALVAMGAWGYGLSPEAKETAARASRRAVNRPITRPASGVGIGIDQVRRPSAAANAAKNSRCDSAGGPSLVTLYARKPWSGASSAATAADATLPAYTHDKRFVPGPIRGTNRSRAARSTRGVNRRSRSP